MILYWYQKRQIPFGILRPVLQGTVVSMGDTAGKER